MKKLILLMFLFTSLFSGAQNADTILIDSEGVGAVKLGMSLQELPAQVPGLYDKIVNENSDIILYSFYLNGEGVMTTAGNDVIEAIYVLPSLVNVTTADGVHPGMTEYKFRSLKGWKKCSDESFVKDGVTVDLQFGEITNMQTGEFEDF